MVTSSKLKEESSELAEHSALSNASKSLKPSSFNFSDYLNDCASLNDSVTSITCSTDKSLEKITKSNIEISKGKISVKDVQRLLDGFLLLDVCNVEFPEEATRANLSDRKLNNVVQADLQYFKRLSFLDLGNNQVCIENLTDLRSLEELRLHCNGVRAIPQDWGGEVKPFPMLVTLDLSYNGIENGKDLIALTSLKRLRNLDLTCNGLKSIPADFCKFLKLEDLRLENNKIGSSESIINLSKIPKLRELNLDRNCVRYIPHQVLFKNLEWLSLANNQIEKQDNIVPLLVRAENLSQLILYGNPITTGKVSTKMKSSIDTEVLLPIEGESCEQIPETILTLAPSVTGGNREDDEEENARYLQQRKVVNLVTDPPNSKRVRSRSSRSSYAHFQVATVIETHERTPSQWKSIGNEYLLGSRSKSRTSRFAETRTGNTSSGNGLPMEPIDNRFSRESLLSDERRVHSRLRTSESGSGFFMTDPGPIDGEESSQDEDSGDEYDEHRERDRIKDEDKYLVKVPTVAELRQKLGLNPPPRYRKCDPAKLRSAVISLRAALQNPLSLTKNVDADNIAEKHHFEKPTKAFRMRLKKKQPYIPIESRSTKKKNQKVDTNKQEAQTRRSRANQALKSIESVLDQMRIEMDDEDKLPSVENITHPMAECSKVSAAEEADAAVTNLIDTVNTVMKTFDN